MPRYRSCGGGAPISTRNEITNWGQSTCEGASAPEYYKGAYPSDRIVHKWPEPAGERRSYDDATPSRYSPSGASHPAGEAITSAAKHNVRANDGPLRQGIAHKYQDRHSRAFGFGSGERAPSHTSRVAYKDGEGNTKYRGVTG